MHSTDRNNSRICSNRSLQTCAHTRRVEAGPSRKSASRVWTVAIQCRHRQTESRALHSSLMALPPSSTCFSRQSAKRIHSAPSLVSPAHKSTGLFYSPRPSSGPASRLKEISCCTAPFLSPLMKTSCSACARREACEMATHPHRPAHTAPDGPALACPGTGAKLLIAAQWGLTLLGLFCLIGVAVVIATTPEAWPL